MLGLGRSDKSTIIDSIMKEAKVDKKAKEFATKEALEKYLHEHPKSDPSKHKVLDSHFHDKVDKENHFNKSDPNHTNDAHDNDHEKVTNEAFGSAGLDHIVHDHSTAMSNSRARDKDKNEFRISKDKDSNQHSLLAFNDHGSYSKKVDKKDLKSEIENAKKHLADASSKAQEANKGKPEPKRKKTRSIKQQMNSLVN